MLLPRFELGRLSQGRLAYAANFLVALLGAMAYASLVPALHVPRHQCRDEYNYATKTTVELPASESSPYVVEDARSCLMFLEDRNETIGCLYGYEYDKTWFESTLVSSQDWVCDRSVDSANLVATIKGAEVIGAVLLFLFGNSLSPPSGFALLALLLLAAACRTLAPLLVAPSFGAFCALLALGALPTAALAAAAARALDSLLPAAEDAEPSRASRRWRATLARNAGWSCACCALAALHATALGDAGADWRRYACATAAPLWLFAALVGFTVNWFTPVSYCRDLIKSLRDSSSNFILLSTHRAKNSSDRPSAHNDNDSVPSAVGDLFVTFRSSQFAIVLIFGWISTLVPYTALFLSAVNSPGDPTWNFALQALIEAPAYACAKLSSDRFGRKCTSYAGFWLATMSLVGVALVVEDADMSHLHSVLSGAARFGLSFSYYVINVQGPEIFGECSGHTVNALGTILGNWFAIASPYIVYWGRVYDPWFSYFVIFYLTLAGGLSSLFLPETLNETMPANLEEFDCFGKSKKKIACVQIDFNELQVISK